MGDVPGGVSPNRVFHGPIHRSRLQRHDFQAAGPVADSQRQPIALFFFQPKCQAAGSNGVRHLQAEQTGDDVVRLTENNEHAGGSHHADHPIHAKRGMHRFHDHALGILGQGTHQLLG